MNSPVAYCLLLLYLTVAFKPLVPIIQDAWEHAFNEAEHLATVHVHSGNHHLQKEIADQDADQKHDDHALRSVDEVPAHLFPRVFAVDFTLAKGKSNYPLAPFHHLPLLTLASPSPPPKTGQRWKG